MSKNNKATTTKKSPPSVEIYKREPNLAYIALISADLCIAIQRLFAEGLTYEDLHYVLRQEADRDGQL